MAFQHVALAIEDPFCYLTFILIQSTMRAPYPKSTCLLQFAAAFLLLFALIQPLQAQLCNGAGNVVVFTNYDGSGNTAATRLNIDVDVNIPNLKIGIASYERVTVNITGTFAGNVTAVRWAGYGASNNHCASAAATVITGVPAGIITYVTAPPSTVSDPLGNTSIIGGYACTPPNGTGNGGGSASTYQMVNYFISAFGPGSSLRSAFAQYGCWAGLTRTLSAANSGNCCPLVVVLPVELIAFRHACQGKEISLDWTTASELNNGSFTVERSADGVDFAPVAQLAGAGDANETTDYHWTDADPLPDMNYYRLSQTDHNGETRHLNTIAAENCHAHSAQLRILNSQGAGSLAVQYLHDLEADANLRLAITDAFGREVFSREQAASTGSNLYLLDVSMLASGVYVLTAHSGSRTLHRKFIHN
jgi:hypothetical protein